MRRGGARHHARTIRPDRTCLRTLGTLRHLRRLRSNLAALNQYFFDSSDIIAFWNYVPLVYCVKSRLTATALTLKLRPFFPLGTFFVAEINPRNIDGSLPPPAWEWFYLEHHEKHRAPAPPPTDWLPGLPGLLGTMPPLSPFPSLPSSKKK